MIFRTPHSLPLLSRWNPPTSLLSASGRWAGQRRDCRNAFQVWLSGSSTVRALRQSGRWLGGIVGESGLVQHWRFLLLLALLSFATAWMGTRAVMAGFENTWTEVGLAAARHENQELRTRQETLREETEAALADLAAAEAAPAATPARYP